MKTANLLHLIGFLYLSTFPLTCFAGKRMSQCSSDLVYGSMSHRMFGVRTLYEVMQKETGNKLPSAENRTNPALSK